MSEDGKEVVALPDLTEDESEPPPVPKDDQVTTEPETEDETTSSK